MSAIPSRIACRLFLFLAIRPIVSSTVADTRASTVNKGDEKSTKRDIQNIHFDFFTMFILFYRNELLGILQYRCVVAGKLTEKFPSSKQTYQ